MRVAPAAPRAPESDAADEWRAPWWTTEEAVHLARRILRMTGDEVVALYGLQRWAAEVGLDLEPELAAVLIIVAADREDTLRVACAVTEAVAA